MSRVDEGEKTAGFFAGLGWVGVGFGAGGEGVEGTLGGRGEGGGKAGGLQGFDGRDCLLDVGAGEEGREVGGEGERGVGVEKGGYACGVGRGRGWGLGGVFVRVLGCRDAAVLRWRMRLGWSEIGGQDLDIVRYFEDASIGMFGK